MGALMRAQDWSTSSLGDPTTWPQSLRTAVRLILNSGHPMYIWWGADGACLYNDAYRQSIGPERHPGSLGRPAREVWSEIWDIIGPQIEQVMAGRGATWNENHLVPITRNGRREDVYWTYSYSPIDDESAPNGVGGVLVVCAETTEVVKAKAEADQHRERLAQMFNQAPSFIAMLMGPEHRFELTNIAYRNLVGRDVLGKTVAEALPEAVEQGYVQLLDRVFASGQAISLKGAKFTIRATPGGQIDERYVDFIYQPITGANGKTTGIFVEGSDVTNQKRAETALQELNATLETKVEERTREHNRLWTHSRDLMMVVGVDGIFRAVNPAWTRVFGHLPEEVVGRSFREFVYPEDADGSQGRLNHASQGKDLSNFENRYLHKDGSIKWIAWHTSLEGDIIYVYGRDITAEKAATKALEQSEAQLRAVFETSHQFQGLLNLDGVMLDANTASLTAINATIDDVIGQYFWDTPWFEQTPGMTAAVRASFMKAVKGDVVQHELKINLPVGGWRWFDFTLRPVRNIQGEIVSIVPEAVETTERRQVEEALRQSQRMEAVGQLTGGVAHDFNNLMAAISGGLQLLSKTEDKERRAQVSAHMTEAINKGARLTRQMLAFARGQHLAPTIINPLHQIEAMRDLLDRAIGEDIKIEMDLAADLENLEVDLTQLELVILNLAVNARDAMPRGGRLSISAKNVHRTEAPMGDFVRIAIQDTGDGMSPEVVEHAFEPFFTTKDVGRGTGLGLAQVYGFVKQSGGMVWIESHPGKGTTIFMDLPRSTAPLTLATAATTSITTASTSKVTARRDAKILVVEDDDSVAMVVQQIMEEFGFKCHRVTSAREALAVLEIRDFDLMFSDVVMPGGINGLELASDVRNKFPHMPIILTTGYGGKAEIETSGFQVFQKPYDPQSLLTAIEAAINNKE